jgi:hypothetical protein
VSGAAGGPTALETELRRGWARSRQGNPPYFIAHEVNDKTETVVRRARRARPVHSRRAHPRHDVRVGEYKLD